MGPDRLDQLDQRGCQALQDFPLPERRIAMHVHPQQASQTRQRRIHLTTSRMANLAIRRDIVVNCNQVNESWEGVPWGRPSGIHINLVGGLTCHCVKTRLHLHLCRGRYHSFRWQKASWTFPSASLALIALPTLATRCTRSCLREAQIWWVRRRPSAVLEVSRGA